MGLLSDIVAESNADDSQEWSTPESRGTLDRGDRPSFSEIMSEAEANLIRPDDRAEKNAKYDAYVPPEQYQDGDNALAKAGYSVGRNTVDLYGGIGSTIKWAGNRLGSDTIADVGASMRESADNVDKELFADYNKNVVEPEGLNENVVERPSNLLSPTWWLMQIVGILPSFGASVIPGAGAQKVIQVGGKLMPFTEGTVNTLARVGGAVTGGAAGGSLEGAQVYEEALRRGAPEEVASDAFVMMSGFSAGMNAVSLGFMMKDLPNTASWRFGKHSLSGMLEGVTEGLEEPVQAKILDDDMAESWRQFATVFGPAAVTGGLGSVASGEFAGDRQETPGIMDDLPEGDIEVNPDDLATIQHGMDVNEMDAEEVPAEGAQQPPDETVAPVAEPEQEQAPVEEPATEPEGDGTRDAPIKVDAPEHVEAAGEQVEAEPTEAQAEAGNYKKGHVKMHGLDITIENPKGSTRRGTSPDGTKWEADLAAHYGYVKRTEGADGDQVDVFIGDDPQSESVFIIDQVEVDGEPKFDEHKVMLGFNDSDTALQAYVDSFSDGKGVERAGELSETTIDEFKRWLEHEDTTKPFGDMEYSESTSESEPVAEPVPPSPAVAQPPTQPDKREGEPSTPDEGGTSSSDKEPETAPAEDSYTNKYGEVMLETGIRLKSKSGRELSPAPKIDTSTKGKLTNSMKRVNQWLLDEAIKENPEEDPFETGTTNPLPGMLRGMDPNNLSQSDKDTINLALFGEHTGPSADQVLGISEELKKPKKKAKTNLGAKVTPQVTGPMKVKRPTIADSVPSEINEDLILEDLADTLMTGDEKLKNANDVRKFISERRGGEPIKPGTMEAKEADEILEYAAVKAARTIIRASDKRGQEKVFDMLSSLQKNMPGLNVRTSTSVAQQAYSTPLPIAYVASRIVGVDRATKIYEPTAGNGALLIEADQALANEINPGRAKNLKATGFTVDSYDASVKAPAPKSQDVVIANPPFGAVKEENGQSRSWALGEKYTSTQIDHAIALKSLESMKDDGRAVLIVGAPKDTGDVKGYRGRQKRLFYNTLYQGYNVVDHVTVSGKLYAKQGAAWPVDIIVINGRGESSLAMPFAEAPRVIDSMDGLKEVMKNGRDLLESTARVPSSGDQDARKTGSDDDAGVSGKPVEPASSDVEGVGRPGGRSSSLRGGGGAAGSATAKGGNEPKGSDQVDADRKRSDRKPDDDGGGKRNEDVAGTEAEGSEAGVQSDREPDGLGGEDRVKRAGETKIEDVDQLSDGDIDALIEDSSKDTRPQEHKDVAKRVAEYGVEGAADAMVGLAELFGTRDNNKLGMGLSFDEETYKKALPYFRSAWKNFKAAGRVLKEYVDYILKEFGNSIKPYLSKFIKEVRDEAANQEPAPKKSRKAIETKGQVHYEPASKKSNIGTLVPANMKDSTAEALSTLEERVGSVDSFVARELGYKESELGNYFSAEQIDAIALAVDNVNNGGAFIIGDQTGIGKGRFVAAMLWHGIKKGRIPVFITAKPNLYADMYRDLVDIGKPDVRILATNNGLNLKLSSDGTVKIKNKGKMDSTLRAVQKQIEENGKMSDYDVIFTTYGQLTITSGKLAARHLIIDSLGPRAQVVFDESHEAGGGGKQAIKYKDGNPVLNRALFSRQIAERAGGVVFSSATYAKRPDVMDLYARTNMRYAVNDPKQLGDAIGAGGVPLQQAVAAMLNKDGQMIRRERSFDGVEYNVEMVESDKELADESASIMRDIYEFSKNVEPVIEKISEELAGVGGSASGNQSVGDSGVSSTQFSSVMHNLIGQMLLSLKTKKAAEAAIADHENGMKPVIGLANTNGAFIAETAKDLGLSSGDEINLSFADLMERYLKKTRIITEKDIYGKVEKTTWVSDEDIGPMLAREYNAIVSKIHGSKLTDMKASPIDDITLHLKKAGLRVGEITGRSVRIVYDEAGNGTVETRTGRELSIQGRLNTVNDFNAGDLDVVILNQSGATGLSMHSSEKFADQKRRVMILAQTELNIDTHMQMLGRVHRTGQVVPPVYRHLVLDIPAEQRPAAIHAQKMAHLNANTTAARDSAFSTDMVPDFMNKYGNEAAIRIMEDDPDINAFMGLNLEDDDLIKKFTGRIPLYSVKQQRELYDALISEYKEEVEHADTFGGGAGMEAKTIDADAKTLKTVQVFKGDKTIDSLFASDAVAEVVDMKRIGQSMTKKQMIAEVVKDSGLPKDSTLADVIAKARVRHQEMWEELKDQIAAYKIENVGEIKDEALARKAEGRINAAQNRIRQAMATLVPGEPIEFYVDDETYYGVVSRFEHKGKAKNPVALGSWRVKILVADSLRSVSLPLTKVVIGADSAVKAGQFLLRPPGYVHEPVVDMFDSAQSKSRETRTIITGNVLAGFGKFQAGQLVNFSNQEGKIQPGILMPKKFNVEETLEKAPVQLPNADHIIEFIRKVAGGGFASAKSGFLQVSMSYGANEITFTTKSSKASGSRFFLNAPLLKAAKSEFVKSGSYMRMKVGEDAARRAFKELERQGVGFEAKSHRDVARSVTGEEKPALTEGGEKLSRPIGGPAIESDKQTIIQAVKDAAARIAPGADLKIVDEYFGEGPALTESGASSEKRQAVAGGYKKDGNIIHVAMEIGDPLQTIGHEAVHFLKEMGMFTHGEWQALLRKATQKWLNEFGVKSHEESIAYAFGKWRRGYLERGLIERIFTRISMFLHGVKNALRGNGYTSVEHIFRDIESGRVGVRTPREKSIIKKLNEKPSEVTDQYVEEVKGLKAFIKKGEYIDRTLNAPFKAVGLVSKTGEMKPTKFLHDFIANAITTAVPREGGVFSFMTPMLEFVRGGLHDRHGLPKEYVERDSQMAREQRIISMKAVEFLDNLKEMKLTVEESTAIGEMVVGNKPDNGRWLSLRQEIRDVIEELGQEAVRLGLISKESFERNRGTYMHRVYMKYELPDQKTAIGRFAHKRAMGKRKAIYGKAMQGRGITMKFDIDKLGEATEGISKNESIKDFFEGKKLVILERPTQKEDAKRRISKRTILTEEQYAERQDEFEDWENRGSFEIRAVNKRGTKVTLWRDLTKAERENLGEILDVRYILAKTFQHFAKDLSTGRFLSDIADTPEYTRTEKPDGVVVDGSDRGYFTRAWHVYSHADWVKVPDTKIPKTGGKLRWGNLAGKYVRAEIWRDLNQLDLIMAPPTWSKIIREWKVNKTARAAGVHMNNVMSNIVLMDFAGVRMQDLARGIISYINKDEHFQNAADHGAFGAGFIENEIGRKALEPILKDVLEMQNSGGINVAKNVSLMTKVMSAFGTAIKTGFLGEKLDRKLVQLYQAEDEVFRMATYLRRIELGETPAVAANFARDQFLNYDIRAPWINALRMTGLPFISYSYRAIPKVAQSVSYRPLKLVKLAAMIGIINALSYDLDPGDEDEERAALRKEWQGFTWVGSPRLIRTPFGVYTDRQDPVFLDVKRWIPVGDVFDMNQGHGAVPIPPVLQISGPILAAFEVVLNKTSFTGKEIVDEYDGALTASKKLASYGWKFWMPSSPWVPFSYYNEKVIDSIQGSSDAYTGKPESPYLMMLSSMGVKLREHDVETALEFKMYRFNKALRDIAARRRRATRQYNAGHMSGIAYNRLMKDYETKQEMVYNDIDSVYNPD